MSIYILGIETSCDDTSAAILKDNKILANKIAGQEVHKGYGGVVPELASRAHQQHIVPVVDVAFREAGITKDKLHAIAFTRGPGLLGSLLVGTSFAKAMALGMNIPLIEVDHLQAHVLAHFIHNNNTEPPELPFICLTVSGGHSQIEIIKDYFQFELLGQTIDDAAGEAFDKAAKILGLPYPGGPLIDKHAQDGNSEAFKLPHPKVTGYNYSFSGLKTSFLYLIRDHLKSDADFIKKNLNDLCASIQKAIIDVLLHKLTMAVEDTKIKRVAIAGGVSANSSLRQRLKDLANEKGWKLHIPPFEYCTDNAAMIAIAGYYKYKAGIWGSQSAVPYARKNQ